MALTIPQLLILDLGYLSGKDLVRWCPAQILINQDAVDNTCLQEGVSTAMDEVRSATRTRYNLAPEFLKTAADRERMLVKIVSILAVRNAVGNLNVSEKTLLDFAWADKEVKALRAGQSNLLQPPTVGPAPTTDGSDPGTGPGSKAEMINSNFGTIG